MSGGRRPVIGLTGSCWDDDQRAVHGVADAYVQALYAAGALPLHIPCLPGDEVTVDLLGLVDGLVLTGGADVDPKHFGELPRRGLGQISPQRDALEIPLARAAIAADMPVLAICRGMQVLNVAAGGTLYQDLYFDLPDVLQHNQNAPRWYPTHPVELERGSILHRIVGQTTIYVNSFHHQAVRELAPGLHVTAHAPDGVIEAVEMPAARFIVGVQWHPECLMSSDHGRRLFEALVAVAR